MDLFDRAQELEELQRNASITEARMMVPEGPLYTGKCAYCTEPVPSPRRFCDGECREDWEHEQAALKRNNGVRPWLEDSEETPD